MHSLKFNEELRVSANDLSEKHGQLDGIWSDSAAIAYAKLYEPLEASLKQYLGHDAPRMEDFINTKIKQLYAYLHGA